MTLFLTHDELTELTGMKAKASQVGRLAELGIVYRKRADGAILVLRAHLENTFGVSHTVASRKRVEPDFRNAR